MELLFIKKEIINILKQANFFEGTISYVQRIFPIDYEKKFNQPFHQKTLDNPILQLDPQERIMESLAQLIDLKEFYLNQGIPLPYFYKSIYDLNYRIERYYKLNRYFGLTDSDIEWLSLIYKGEIFDLGSLRFQITGFSYREIERDGHQYMLLPQKWKERFPEGTPIITIHILDKTDFRPEKVDESLAIARDFFADYFPMHHYEVFVCRSWLLYKPTRDILNSDSNIVSFSKRFQVIADNQNAKQALDRIYGTSHLDKIQKMEKKSSLAKIAYKHLDKLGVAAGIIHK